MIIHMNNRGAGRQMGTTNDGVIATGHDVVLHLIIQEFLYLSLMFGMVQVLVHSLNSKISKWSW